MSHTHIHTYVHILHTYIHTYVSYVCVCTLCVETDRRVNTCFHAENMYLLRLQDVLLLQSLPGVKLGGIGVELVFVAVRLFFFIIFFI